jgi:hypothetical protein
MVISSYHLKHGRDTPTIITGHLFYLRWRGSGFFLKWTSFRLPRDPIIVEILGHVNLFGGQMFTSSCATRESGGMIQSCLLEERGYRFYSHYTITGASHTLEPHVPG